MSNEASFCALPERAIERLFARFAAMYGDAAMKRMWGQQSLADVKAIWAQGLGRCDVERVRQGLQLLEREGKTFPPSLPEFVALCERKPEPVAQMHRPALPVPARTADEVAAGAQRLAAAKAAVASATRRVGDRDWALRVLERAAAGDKSLAPITVQIAREALGAGA